MCHVAFLPDLCPVCIYVDVNQTMDPFLTHSQLVSLHEGMMNKLLVSSHITYVELNHVPQTS